MAAGTLDPTSLYIAIGVAAVFGISTLILAARGRVNALGVWGILSFTFRDAIRSKWLMMFAVVFFLLAADLPLTALLTLNLLSPRYAPLSFSALLSGTVLLIPLLSLPNGAVSIVDDRESGTLQYLLSNPITKFDFFLGRITGLLLATTAVIVLAFGSAAVVVYASNAFYLGGIFILMLTATLLNAVMLALALIISEVSKRRATALGIALFFWFLFTAVSGVDTLTYAVYWNSGVGAALSLMLLDPVETSRIATVVAGHLNVNQELGLNGRLAQHFLTDNLLPVAVGSVVVWLVLLLAIAFLIFMRQDAS